MNGRSGTRRVESPWPVGLAVLCVLALLQVLPARIRLLPAWIPWVIVAAMLTPLAGVRLSGGSRGWSRVERVVTLLFGVCMGVSNVLTLASVFRAMVNRTEMATGLQLLSSGTAMWAINVLAFSLVYWQTDRGGSEARANEADVLPDWQFPQTSAPESVRPGWRPTYVDYLTLSFTTATAFSPTDVLPLTSRAKLFMMLESVISLVTIAVVASRAINILGS